MENFSEFDNRDDNGKIAENFIFRELLTMGFKAKYWRTTSKGEIDFIIQGENGIVPIEVKQWRPGRKKHIQLHRDLQN